MTIFIELLSKHFEPALHRSFARLVRPKEAIRKALGASLTCQIHRGIVRAFQSLASPMIGAGQLLGALRQRNVG